MAGKLVVKSVLLVRLAVLVCSTGLVTCLL